MQTRIFIQPTRNIQSILIQRDIEKKYQEDNIMTIRLVKKIWLLVGSFIVLNLTVFTVFDFFHFQIIGRLSDFQPAPESRVTVFLWLRLFMGSMGLAYVVVQR